MQQSRSSLRTQWESLHQSRLFAFSASDWAPLPVQQTHGSLQSPGEPSVCRLSYAAYSAADEALPPGAAEPLAPFGCMGALHPMRQPRLESPCLFSVGRGSPCWCSRPTAPSSRRVSPPSVVGVMLHTRRRTRLSLPVQQSRRLPPVTVGALHPTCQTAPRLSCKRDPPFRCSRATAPSGRSESPSFDICHRAPLPAACRARQSDAAAAAPVEHRTSSPVALPPFYLADSNPYLSTAGIFWGAINSRSLATVPSLKLLLGSSLGSGHVPGSEPSPRTASQNMLTICYQIKCKGELVKWCFINKVREEHDQIINQFGTGATRLANHPNEHNAFIYIYRCSLPTSVLWQFSGIPPPPQLLTPNLFYPSSGTGEFSGFRPCSGLGALPQDSKPKYAYHLLSD